MIPSATAAESIFLSRTLLSASSSSSSFSMLPHQATTIAEVVPLDDGAAGGAPESAAVRGDISRCGGGSGSTLKEAATVPSLASAGFIGPMATLILLDLIVIIGNSLVVAAVLTQRKLRTVTNTFIVSLAMSDLFLGLVVLPFSSANQVLGYWPFGAVWCSAWLAIDVWLCTASILNLCAISLDRFLAIRCPFRYPSLMPPLRAKLSIAVVWILSLAICIPPLLGWKDEEPDGQLSPATWNHTTSPFTSSSYSSLPSSGVDESEEVTLESSGRVVAIMWLPESSGDECRHQAMESSVLPKCELTSEPGYIIYSACGSFWIPMFIMVSFYVRIYRTAARATLALRRGIITKRGGGGGIASSSSDSSVNLRVHRGGGCGGSSTVQVLHLPGPPDSPRCSSSMSSPSTDPFDRVHRFRVHLPDIHGSPESSPRTSSSRDGGGGSGGIDAAKIPPGIQCLLRTACSPVYEELPRCRHGNNTACGNHSSGGGAGGGGAGGGGAGGRKGLVQIRTQLRRLNREKKAAKTVGIIVGCFIFCWSPFFTVYLLGAFCIDCTPDWVFTIFFWLGYCNSAINPIIYGLCSKDFRYAFKRLVRCSRHQSRTQLARLISGLHQNKHATTHHGSNIDFMSVVYR